MKFMLIPMLILGIFLFFSPVSSAEPPSESEKPQIFKARVVSLSAEGAKIKLEEGKESGKEIILSNPGGAQASIDYQPGTTIFVSKIDKLDGTTDFVFVDHDRSKTLWIIGVIFGLAVITIGRWKGFRALLSLAFSFLILFYFVIPRILSGSDPVVTTILGSFLILTSLLYLTHGLNWKTSSAVLGTSVSLIFTGIIAIIFVNLAKLSGLSEDALYVQNQIGNINVRGLLLSGVILGAVGVLDDLCIGQASAVWELHKSNSKLEKWDLFRRAMNIGTDHIAASVNTLVMAYVGAALPLVLLITQSGVPLGLRFSSEIVSTEIIRALVGTIGLIFAVPMTTLIASYLVKRNS